MDQLKPEMFRAIRAKAGALVVVLPKDMLQPSPDLLEVGKSYVEFNSFELSLVGS